ncbi:TAXI family TRAP transporter solute-binding subunit [Pseudooceanicola sp.]|uniref:TAXI family TRAP transporter solute-binding subunit n=1 Tax=Pseudooceanicola sp. TaxID=1914328 RepID=UPI00262AA92E|nr:TAXI family TRAP transporter solute-binding subunit [Pseudooceanicola sp.]MDF1855874.1 TAXI family TRAP transporter solute-binding subunit [Pseudooceanicola sp.]
MRILTIGAAAMLAASAVSAADYDLPKTVTWTAYATGSSGYNQAVAIGAAMQNVAGINLRILPGKNDLSRLEPVRQGKVQFSANGVGTYMAQEGVFDFGEENWGPQRVRILINNVGSGSSLTVAANKPGCEAAGKPDCKGFEYKDFKGLKVAFVKGAPALNANMEAYLAYGGLTWDDVEVVEFGGFGASWKGFIEGQVHAAYGVTTSGNAYEAESGPNGLYWPSIDPNDTAAMGRMKDKAPYFVPVQAMVGAGLDGTDGVPSASYPYPILIAYDIQDVDLTYNMTKAMFGLFDDYKDGAPGANGWALKNQVFDWVVPFHEGAVRYYKEVGLWSDAAQAHNDALIKRQDVLQAAWEEMKAAGASDWDTAWDAKRKAALSAAGMSVSYK